jgi:site-specific DNA-methyltransferase (adenine-specific)
MIYFVPRKSVVLAPERQRETPRTPDELNELVKSIRTDGLIHPVTIIDGTLQAGYGRFEAMSVIFDLYEEPIRIGDEVLPADHIPAIVLGKRSALQIAQLEFDENRCRTQLTWVDEVRAVAKLKRLRELEAEASGTPLDTKALAVEVTQKESPSRGDIVAARETIALEKYLHDPAVAGAKTKKDAIKVIERQEQIARTLAQTPTPLNDVHKVHFADARNLLPTLPSGSVDHIISDPPYGIGAQAFGGGAQRVEGLQRHTYDDSFESWCELMPPLLREAFRLSKPTSYMTLFCDFGNFSTLKGFAEDAGWRVARTPLIWDKVHSNRAPVPGVLPYRTYECILLAYRPEAKLAAGAFGTLDVLHFPADENLGHSAQKPVALFEALVRMVSSPGQVLLDFCAGSGPLLPAAHTAYCKSILIENEENSHGIILQRRHGLSSPTPSGDSMRDSFEGLSGA